MRSIEIPTTPTPAPGAGEQSQLLYMGLLRSPHDLLMQITVGAGVGRGKTLPQGDII